MTPYVHVREYTPEIPGKNAAKFPQIRQYMRIAYTRTYIFKLPQSSTPICTITEEFQRFLVSVQY